MDESGLAKALRAYLDLQGSPDEFLKAWRRSPEQDRKDCLDSLLHESLLLDALGPANQRATSQQRPSIGGAASKRSGHRLWFAATAAAACLLLAVSLWLVFFNTLYSPARAEGEFSILNPSGGKVVGSSLTRGQSLVAGPSGARLTVGGYCRLELEPNTKIVLAGEPHEEVIELEVGKVISWIEHEKGEFRIKTVRGTVEAVGTEFSTIVDYPSAVKGGRDMNGINRRLSAVVTVMVISGTVLYQFGDLSGHLGAGMTKIFAAEVDDVRGEVVSSAEDRVIIAKEGGGRITIEVAFVRREGRLVRNEEMSRFVKSLKRGDLVKAVYIQDRNRYFIKRLERTHRPRRPQHDTAEARYVRQLREMREDLRKLHEEIAELKSLVKKLSEKR